MVARSVWKGFLKLDLVTCSVKLVGATSESEKVRFRTLNRKTGSPVKAQYRDEATGQPVEAEDQVKGYELDKGDYLAIEKDEIDRLKVESTKQISVSSFVAKDTIERIYFDKPYYLLPADAISAEPFAMIREAMARKKMAGMATIVLYQKERPVLIEPVGKAMLLTTLRYKRQIVSSQSVFEGIGKVKVDPEMADIAALIIDRKVGKFEPSLFEDTYENALLELIRAKQHGDALPKAAPKPKANVVDLFDALKRSLKAEGGASQPDKPARPVKRKAAAEPARATRRKAA